MPAIPTTRGACISTTATTTTTVSQVAIMCVLCVADSDW
ncbi:hypothetical protein GMMP15_1030092 [Candidatus Magnetomoraceae bacterium gMMP-15]